MQNLIANNFIKEWRQYDPWILDAYVEQDLVISRALIELFSSELISSELAFRGGTALHKLYSNLPSRYSEDIDLVQIKASPIGPVLTEIRTIFYPWLGALTCKLGVVRAPCFFM